MVAGKFIQHHNNLFWEALVISVFIFGCGILLGVLIENNRLQSVSNAYQDVEEKLLDVKAQTELFDMNIDCDVAIAKNIEFGDAIYHEALKLEKYEDSRQITDNLISQQRKYSTLRVFFLVNSLKIRERCGDKFDIITYFYEYRPSSIDKIAMQSALSNKFFETKQKYGNSVLLIPIATDLDVGSVEILKSNFDVNDVAVMINTGKVLYSLDEVSRIEEYLMVK